MLRDGTNENILEKIRNFLGKGISQIAQFLTNCAKNCAKKLRKKIAHFLANYAIFCVISENLRNLREIAQFARNYAICEALRILYLFLCKQFGICDDERNFRQKTQFATKSAICDISQIVFVIKNCANFCAICDKYFW